MTILEIQHRTEYRYAKPVTLDKHRLMCRPRDSHDLRLLDTSLSISPTASIRWLHDVFGNSIAIASFEAPTDTLKFVSTFRAEHFPAEDSEFYIEEFARRMPFNYGMEIASDLGRTRERHYPDPQRRVDLWAKQILGTVAGGDTLAVVKAINKAIKQQFPYARREEHGTQTPVETLNLGSGSCRDFAVLMMEALRSLGLATRFVSGYLYDPQLGKGTTGNVVGGGATHAWVQVFLPGAGWVEFDPTNGTVCGNGLIRVAVARDASQAAPLSGSYHGNAADFLGMTVDVQVTVQPQGASLQPLVIDANTQEQQRRVKSK